MEKHRRLPKIYGHRGTRKYAPENTIPAFQIALDQGADGFELDTMLTADGVPVVIHDRSLSRTTNGIGFVDREKASELQKLDAGSWFSDDFKGTPILLLQDVLEIFGDRCEINIELKNLHHPFNSLPEKVCALLSNLKLSDSILISSFVPFNLIRIRQIMPQIKVALLIEDDALGGLLSTKIFRSFSPDFIHPFHASCTNHFLSKQHALGRRVNTWTVNDESTIASLITRGIDGIITDDPHLAVRVRQQS